MATLLMDRGQRIELLELLKCGDSKAWENVVQQYQIPLSRYLYNMVKDKELARDLTQDTFLEAYQAMYKIEGDLNLKAWLYRIATNNAIQVLRRRKLISWLPWTGGTISSEQTAGDYDERLAQSITSGYGPEEVKTLGTLASTDKGGAATGGAG